MRIRGLLTLGSLIGVFAGYLFGLGYCSTRRAASPGAIFSLADSVYYTSTSLVELFFGLLLGGVSARIERRPKPGNLRPSNALHQRHLP